MSLSEPLTECLGLILFVSLQHILTLVTAVVVTEILKQGIHYHKISKAFSKFYRWLSGFVEKHNGSSKKTLQQGILEPEVYDLSLQI